jgi:lysophospholipase L1-like esterase
MPAPVFSDHHTEAPPSGLSEALDYVAPQRSFKRSIFAIVLTLIMAYATYRVVRHYIALNKPLQGTAREIVTRFQPAILKDARPLAVGFIGDSFSMRIPTGGKFTVPQLFGKLLSDKLGRPVTIVNYGISGAPSTDWLPGTRTYETALVGFQANHVQYVLVQLGTNDSNTIRLVPVTQYLDNMRRIVKDLNTRGFIVMLNHPPYAEPVTRYSKPHATSTFSVPLLASYSEKLDVLVDKKLVVQGTTSAYGFFKKHNDLLEDGVHPNQKGVEILAWLWMNSFLSNALPGTERAK